MKLFNNIKNNKAIGLIEVIVSLGISTIIITSLISLNIFTLRTSLKGKLYSEASNSTSKQLELVRAFRDTYTWNEFISSMEYCKSNDENPICIMQTNSTGLYVDTNGPSPKVNDMSIEDVSVGFYVLNNIDSQNDELISVVAVSQYLDAGEIKKITLRADFTNWQNK